MPRFRKSLVSLFLLPAVFVLGCQETSPAPVVESHEHEEGHHHPDTLAEALTELTELRDTIRAGGETRVIDIEGANRVIRSRAARTSGSSSSPSSRWSR